MIDSKLTFRVQEIEDGKSQREILLEADDLDFDEFEDLTLKRAEVEISFEKRLHFIHVDYRVRADLQVTCDRSLRLFDYPVQEEYKVLFKPTVETPSEGKESKVKEIDAGDLTISIDREVRDSILLGLPVKKIHPDYLDEDGRPLDFIEKRFGAPDEEEEPAPDPRWEALKKLKSES